jgi:hypothetical protein
MEGQKVYTKALAYTGHKELILMTITPVVRMGDLYFSLYIVCMLTFS